VLQLLSLQGKKIALLMSARQMKEPQRLIHANIAIYLPSCVLVNCHSMEGNKKGRKGEEVLF
jgi:hypothetical protein